MKKVYKSIDITKFILAYVVVLVHAVGFHLKNNISWFLTEHLIFRLTVPFFFITSGFFLGMKVKAQPERKNEFIRKNVKSLSIHYLFWGSVYTLIGFVFNIRQGIGLKQNVFMSLRDFITFNPSAMWYLGALIFSFLVLAIIKTKKSFLISIPIGILFYIFGLFLGSYSGIFTGTIIEPVLHHYYMLFVSSSNGLFVGYIFVAIGYYFGAYKEKETKVQKSWLQLLIGYVVLAVELAAILLVIPDCLQGNYDYLLGILIIVPALFELVQKCKIPDDISTGFVRKASSTVYFSHMAVISGVHIIFKTHFAVEFVIAAVLVTLGAYIVYKWNNKYINLIT